MRGYADPVRRYAAAVAPLSIPSPGDPFLINTDLFQVRWYGLLLALGVLIAGWMTRREFRRRQLDPELVYSIAVWAVPIGLIGARLYHVATDWDAFSGHLGDVPAIWNGGLSIFGAVLGGMLGTWIGCRRTGMRFWVVADCVAPGLILAQALGRWGNYFNQELYGKPTDLPWGVRIDNPPPQYTPGSAFQPMFLYESITNLLIMFVLLWFVRRYWRRVPAGTVFALYGTLYNAVRIPLETIKIDPADHVLGQRINVWVSLILFLISAAAFCLLFRRRREAPGPAARHGRSGEPATAAAGHAPTERPTAAIEARRRTQRRKKS
jgi:prolipoprotein diacylglyceryl transferase